MPTMMFFECPLDVLEKRILKRAKHSGRSDDNVESMRKRFNTYKEETMPTVDIFRKNGKCVEVDTSKDRQAVYNLVHEKLAVWTDKTMAARPLSERAEMLLGIRPWPSKQKKAEEAKKPEEKKEEEAKKPEEKKEEDSQSANKWGATEYSMIAGGLAVLGFALFKAH